MLISELTQETLTKLARFAVLLTGDAARAQEAMQTAFCSCAGRLAELRNEKAVLRCVGKRLHEILSSMGVVPDSESPVVKLDEPHRSGVALASTELFSSSEIVDLVGHRDARPESESEVVAARAWADQNPLPSGWIESLNTATVEVNRPSFLRNPVVLAGACGVLLLMGVLIWLSVQRMEDFPGREVVEELVAENEDMTGREFQGVKKTVGEMGDWFYMSSFSPYEVPHRFAGLKVVGARVFRHAEHPIAEMLLDLGDDDKALFYVFRGDLLGVKPTAEWQKVSASDWHAAIQAEGGNCYMLCLNGSEKELDRLLSRVKALK